MELVNINNVENITSIGGGPIGAGWTAHFLAKGFKVTSYLHDATEKKIFMKLIKTAWISLEKLGLSKQASLSNLIITNSLEKAVFKTDFVQESAPEVLELKQKGHIYIFKDKKIKILFDTRNQISPFLKFLFSFKFFKS